MQITVNKDDKEVVLNIKKPGPEEIFDARMFSKSLFAKIIKNEEGKDILFREKLNEFLIESGYLSKDDEKKLEEVSQKIIDAERQLARGGKDKEGKKFTKTQAKELALEIRQWRVDQIVLLTKISRYDYLTIEGEVENAEFDFLVSKCVTYANGRPVFKDYDDYISKSKEEYANKAAENLQTLIYGSYEDKDKESPEIKFLMEYNFMDEEMRLINDKNQLVDRDGRLINEEGKYVDEDGNYVDNNGNRVDKDGNPIEEFTPFDD